MSDGSIAIIGASCRFPGRAGPGGVLGAARSPAPTRSPRSTPAGGRPGSTITRPMASRRKSYTWSAGLIDRCRSVRAGVFRHLAARGGADGPAAAGAARTGVARRRGCRHPGEQARRQRRPASISAAPRPTTATCVSATRRAAIRIHDRRDAQHPRQPDLLCLRPARPEPDDRHRLLVVAGRAAPRLRGDSRRPHRDARSSAASTCCSRPIRFSASAAPRCCRAAAAASPSTSAPTATCAAKAAASSS